MTDKDYRKIKEDEKVRTAAALGDKKCGVWYPVSDPPKENIYGIALCVSGQRGHIGYHHAIMLDDCSCYEEGKFWPRGAGTEDLTVHAWMAVPICDIE